jgi:hypothetical protein
VFPNQTVIGALLFQRDIMFSLRLTKVDGCIRVDKKSKMKQTNNFRGTTSKKSVVSHKLSASHSPPVTRRQHDFAQNTDDLESPQRTS